MKVLTAIFAVLALLIAAAAVIFSDPLSQGIGKLAGKLEGSVEGTQDGAQEGKQEGLSAKDTEVDIAGKVEAAGNLEVLSADVVLYDVNSVGEKGKEKYKALMAFYGDVTFTVDLGQAEISSSDSNYEVILPQPEATVRIDEERSKKLDEEMKHSWSGSNEDGYIETMNSIDKLAENTEDKIINYDSLMTAAKDSAEKQVELLVSSASMDEEVSVDVQFQESEGEGTEGEADQGNEGESSEE